MILKYLKEVDFGLDNGFCDAQDLLEFWKKSEIPPCLILFLSSLFNLPQAALMKNLVKNEGFDMQEDYSNEANSEDIFIKQTNFIESKAIKIKCFYQIMYYIFHNGRKKDTTTHHDRTKYI